MNFYRFFSRKYSVDYRFVFIGAVIYGISIGWVLSPNGIAPGGIAGLSVMLGRLLNVGVGTLTVILNIPLLIIGWVSFGGKFLVGTAAAIFVSGAAADASQLISPVTENPMLAAISGGAGLAVGCGIIFLAGATTGGTDIAVRLIKRKKPHTKTGQIFLAIDGTVCLLSGLVFKSIENALYAFMALFVFSKVLDLVLYGGDSAKLTLIISRENRKILPILLNDAKVGCTMLKGSTGYKNTDMDIILCAVKKRYLPKVRDIVLDNDEKAFMLIGNATEIYGEGFEREI